MRRTPNAWRGRRRPSTTRRESDVSTAAAAFVVAPALALGSFLNVVAVRVPARRSLVRPPSSCGACGHEIAWRDKVPVVSWLWLRGRCRYCAARISAVYPLVEALTAVLAVVCVAVFGLTAHAALAFGFCTVLVTLSVIEARFRTVPARYGTAARKMAVPFVAFLSFGGIVALFFGERTLDGYLGVF
jgi:prepilin signal peptidase PulO-like enzyme (type II secretory pathway)